MHRALKYGALAIAALFALAACESAQADASNGASRGATRVATNVARDLAGFCLPTVGSVSASSGRDDGGTSVTVTGTCFTGATSVTFGGVSGTSLSVVGPTSITVTTPAYTSALSSTAADNDVAVAVTNPAGTGTLSAGYRYTSKFAAIFGSLLSNEYRANDPHFSVSSWPDYNNNGAATEATNQPTFNATGWNGGPVVTFDGTNDKLVATLTSAIATSKRPYVMVVGRRVAGGTSKFLAHLSGASANLGFYIATGASKFGFYLTTGGGQTDNPLDSGVAVDTNRHLFEVGYRTSGTADGVIDGTGYNGTVTNGNTGSTLTTLTLGAFSGGALFGNVDIVAVVVLKDAPTSQNLTDARAAFKDSTWRSYNANSLSIP